MPQNVHKLQRSILLLIAIASIDMAVGPSIACAQYSTSFFYRNPRTGFTYSQQVGVGNGSAYSGFNYSNGRQSISSSSGYNGRNFYNGNTYSNRNYTYSQGAAYGPGHYYGGSYYGPGYEQGNTVYRHRAPGTNSPTAGLVVP